MKIVNIVLVIVPLFSKYKLTRSDTGSKYNYFRSWLLKMACRTFQVLFVRYKYYHLPGQWFNESQCSSSNVALLRWSLSKQRCSAVLSMWNRRHNEGHDRGCHGSCYDDLVAKMILLPRCPFSQIQDEGHYHRESLSKTKVKGISCVTMVTRLLLLGEGLLLWRWSLWNLWNVTEVMAVVKAICDYVMMV